MEAIALMADIHANLPAAEAVIADIRRKHKPDRIVSLGDQVNLGPAPCDTLRLLRTESVTCLHGNHEGYILSVMRGEPGYAGANFASLRFNADRLTPQEITFEKELTLSGVTLCHAMPGDDRFPVHNPTLALPRLNAMAFKPGTHIVCGHGHNPMHYRLPNLTLDVVGSVGCMDDGVPGMALYAMLYLSPGRVTLEPCVARYDPSALKPLFIRSGFAEACPISWRTSPVCSSSAISIFSCPSSPWRAGSPPRSARPKSPEKRGHRPTRCLIGRTAYPPPSFGARPQDTAAREVSPNSCPFEDKKMAVSPPS